MKNVVHYILVTFHWILLLTADLSVAMLSYWSGYQNWLNSPHRANPSPPSFHITDLFFFASVIVFTLIIGGTYKPQSSIFHVMRLKNLIKYLSIGYLSALIISFFSESLLVSRLQTIYTYIILVPLIIFERSLLDALWNKLITQKFQLKNVVIYGAGDTGKRLLKAIKNHPKLGYRAVAFFDDHRTSESVIMANPIPVLGGQESFRKYLCRVKQNVDKVFIAMPNASGDRTMRIMKLCEGAEIPYEFVPSLYELTLHRVRQEQLDGIPLFGVKDLRLSLPKRILKRFFDVVGSVVVLVLLAPVFGIISLAIKLTSKGPVIFKQARIGENAHGFILYKFRTMYTDTPEYAVHPIDKDDPRITRVGSYLRRTSLDELPQFWNVLKGEMSIVGPRPEMPFIVEQYTDLHCERLNVKPGITGLWQISGDRSLPIHENIDHDLYYIEHQSLLLDVIITLQTIWFALVRGVGAK
jgi:exopolysaccharide biosynthesis polyprenyl glycosylphosphotransferase